MRKLNMIVSTFFSEVGRELPARFSEADSLAMRVNPLLGGGSAVIKGEAMEMRFEGGGV